MKNTQRQPFHLPRLTRREVLGLPAWGAAGYAANLINRGFDFEREILRPIIEELKTDWSLAAIPNKDFLRIYADKLQHVRFGASYSPEYLQDQLNVRIPHEKAIGYLYHIMGINHIRWGIRWDRCIDSATNTIVIDDGLQIADAIQRFAMYDTFTNGFKIFRWGEVFVDKAVLRQLPQIPSMNAVIGRHEPLAQESQQFVDKLLSRLKEHHRPWMIQPVNEPFNPFGLYQWTTSMDFLEDQMDLTASHFPGIQMLINTAGLPQSYSDPFGPLTLDMAVEMAKRVRHKYSITVGFDYYYDMPQSLLPYYSKHPIDMIAVLYVHSGKDVFQQRIQVLDEHDIDWEATEFQQEWRNYLPEDPVTSTRCLKYGLIRYMKIMPTNRTTYISLWGVENNIARAFKGQTTPQELEKLKLIREINGV